jgi:transcriptional regulator GlxA family with amidase domain
MSALVLPIRLALMVCYVALVLVAGTMNSAWAAPGVEGTKVTDQPDAHAKTSRTLGVVLYPKFELLDVCGPVEMFGNLGGRIKVVMVADMAGPVASAQGPRLVADYGFGDCPQLDLLMVPGGFGTLNELKNEALLGWLRERAAKAEIVMSVCSGSALLAKAGLLDDRRATSNKQWFQLAVGNGPKVKWVKEARWVEDGDRVTSSGVSAGIDMSLAVIARLYGDQAAEKIANGTEYQRQRDPSQDPFAKFAK